MTATPSSAGTGPSPASAHATPAHVVCNRCGTGFDCGAQAGESRCWCMALPVLPTLLLTPDAHCLCPVCLQQALASLPAPALLPTP